MFNKSVFSICAVVTALSLVPFEVTHAQFSKNSSAQYSILENYDRENQAFIVGLAPLSPLARMGRVNTRFEFAYRKNMSVSVMLGVPISTKVPNVLTELIRVDSLGGRETSNRYKSFVFNVGHRFYFGGKKPAGGFYLEPYVRYNRFTLTHEQSSDSGVGNTIITGRLGGVGVGGAFGVQWRIGSRVTLDFTALGLDMRWLGGSLKYQSTDPDNKVVELRDKVQKELADLPFIGDKVAAQLDGDQVKVRIPSFPVPGARCNFTIGVAF